MQNRETLSGRPEALITNTYVARCEDTVVVVDKKEKKKRKRKKKKKKEEKKKRERIRSCRVNNCSRKKRKNNLALLYDYVSTT